MILTCPECKSRYVVNPKALLPRGRTVRCAKCSHSWFENKPQDDIEIVPPAEEEATATSENTKAEKEEPEDHSQDQTTVPEPSKDVSEFPISQPEKRQRPIPKGSNLPALQNQKYGSSKMGWISLMIFVTTIISSFLIFQEAIVSHWPASNKLYTAIGLNEVSSEVPRQEEAKKPINELLLVAGLEPRLEQVNNVLHLYISGYVENISSDVETIPPLIATLKDAVGQDLRSWEFTATANVINANERVTFETSLPNPPSQARDISVSILDNR